jgi:hypothetical protein
MTECGRPLTDVAKCISRDEARDLVKRHGKQRTAFLCCMTCLTQVDRWHTWDGDPAEALAREFFGVKDPELSTELIAIGLLVAAHRDEFDGFMAGIKDTSDLAAARRRRAARNP